MGSCICVSSFRECCSPGRRKEGLMLQVGVSFREGKMQVWAKEFDFCYVDKDSDYVQRWGRRLD